jgi:hypothetical protein
MSDFQTQTIKTLLHELNRINEDLTYDEWQAATGTRFHQLCVDTLNNAGLKTERGKELGHSEMATISHEHQRRISNTKRHSQMGSGDGSIEPV